MYDVLVESVVATRHKSIGTTRLPSSATLARVVGSHGPIAADNSVGPFAFVVDSNLAAEIVEVTVVLSFTVAAVNQDLHVRTIVTVMTFRRKFVRNSKAQLGVVLLLQLLLLALVIHEADLEVVQLNAAMLVDSCNLILAQIRTDAA